MASDSDLRDELLELSPRDFEQFIADVWQERQGWETKVMDKGPDGGIDVLGWPPSREQVTALQAKRYNPEAKCVGAPEVRQYASLRQEHSQVVAVTVTTTSAFTRNATDAADRLDVKLIDGKALVEIIDRYDAYKILDWYLAGKPEVWPRA